MTDPNARRYDISMVRPPILHDEIALRGRDL